MTRPHNHTPEDILPDLVKLLVSVGLQPQMIQIMDDGFALDTEGEFIPLSDETHTQAFQTVQSGRKREIINLVKMIAKDLKEVLEMEVDPDDSNPRPRRPPGGERGIWSNITFPPKDGEVPQGLPAELLPPESDPEKEKNAPRTKQDFYNYISSYLESNPGGYQYDKKTKEELAKRAAYVKMELEDEYGLRADEAATLTKVSLYDIFFLCDDSGSMRIGRRVKDLSKALQSVAFWATKLEPSGISLRFLNYTKDDTKDFNYITDEETIDDLVVGVRPLGGTPLGTMLQKKILRPLKERAESSEGRVKPRIIIIITDGEPQNEREKNYLRTAIKHAKGEGIGKKYGQAMTIFLLAKVGDDPAATKFLDSLVTDPDLRSMIYTLNRPLGEIRNLLAKEVGEELERAYQTLWMRLFNAAFNTQTK